MNFLENGNCYLLFVLLLVSKHHYYLLKHFVRDMNKNSLWLVLTEKPSHRLSRQQHMCNCMKYVSVLLALRVVTFFVQLEPLVPFFVGTL